MQKIFDYFWVNKQVNHGLISIGAMLLGCLLGFSEAVLLSVTLWFYSRAYAQYQMQDLANKDLRPLWDLNILAWPAWRQNKFLWAAIPAVAIFVANLFRSL